MLNMMVAVMSDTFGTMYEKKELYSLRAKFTIVADFQFMLGSTEAQRKNFLFILRRKDLDETDQSHSELVQQIQDLVESESKKALNSMSESVQNLQRDMNVKQGQLKTELDLLN